LSSIAISQTLQTLMLSTTRYIFDENVFYKWTSLVKAVGGVNYVNEQQTQNIIK